LCESQQVENLPKVRVFTYFSDSWAHGGSLNFGDGLLLAAALCGALAAGAAHGQQAGGGAEACRKWAPIPGGSSPADSSYNRCALDAASVLDGAAPMPPAPVTGRVGGGSFTVVVNADGTVDSLLTRPWGTAGDTLFHRQLMEVMRLWRFRPGVLHGAPVRSGFMLHVSSGTRPDTLPARIAWSYRPGAEADSLVGAWTALAPLPAPPDATADSIYMAVLHRLGEMRVVTPGWSRTYCLVLPHRDAAATASLRTRAARSDGSGNVLGRDPLAPPGCERDPTTLRLVFPPVHRTEDERYVVMVTGDFLAEWPTGPDGRSYRAWEARCIGLRQSTGEFTAHCSPRPITSVEESRRWAEDQRRGEFWAKRPPSREPSDIASLNLTVTMQSGDFTWDTLQAAVRPLPRLSERALLLADVPCGPWTAHSPSGGDGYRLLFGDPSGSRFSIVEVRRGEPPPGGDAEPRCGAQEPRMAEFTAFLLPEPGASIDAPVMICFHGNGGCAWRLVLDPVTHVLAANPHVAFPLDRIPMQNDSRRVHVHLRVSEPADDLLMLVLFLPTRGRPIVMPARRLDIDRWETNMMLTGFPGDGEIRVYVMGR
jgi:hypothetical protein